MATLPPIFPNQLFDDLDRTQTSINRIFTPLILELIDYLNQLPCLSDIQYIRKTNGRKSRQLGNAFNSRINAIYPGHWYIYNWGGRNEMQFNIGMYSTNDQEEPYVRIGAGFNFDRAKFGDPPNVARAFSSFVDKIVLNQRSFESFYINQSLDIEFERVNANSVVQWLQRESQKEPDDHQHDWVFIGRKLFRSQNLDILEDAPTLAREIESVFGGLKQYY